MNEVKFKISLIDSFGYPIERWTLDLHGEITEEAVLEAVSKIIPDMTELINRVKKEDCLS